jgi:deferrochelatase/peroxidase EfeB
VSDRPISRRSFLLAAGGGAAALAAAAAGGGYLLAEHDGDGGKAETVPFHGEHQAGIATPAQDRIVFGSFDATTTSRTELEGLLRDWTAAAEKLTAGKPLAELDDSLPAPPVDTGEALGLAAARLTITFGFGPTLFDRFALGSRRPSGLVELPVFPHDALDPARSGGDICIQACADDPVVAFHAVRNLARIGFGRAALRWTQLGFGRTSSTTSSQTTPRNLQGFKDGTNNIDAEDPAAMAEHVWVGDDEPQAWLHGGSYLVARRIRMLIETWDRSTLDDQQRTIGRFKQSGAPLTGSDEHDKVDLAAVDSSGLPVIPGDAHIRLAGPARNGGHRILRRGYSYTDGIDPRTGELDAGLFFVAFQRSLENGFVAIQNRLSTVDALNEYIVHTGSAVFAVPPGAPEGGFVGEQLFRR